MKIQLFTPARPGPGHRTGPNHFRTDLQRSRAAGAFELLVGLEIETLEASRDQRRVCTCWASLVLKASLSNSTAAEGSTNRRVEPTIRAKRQRSSCMKAMFLLSYQNASVSADARERRRSCGARAALVHSQRGSYTSPGSAQTGGS